MQKSLFPGYTVGPDAYDDIVNVCPAYGKKRLPSSAARKHWPPRKA